MHIHTHTHTHTHLADNGIALGIFAQKKRFYKHLFLLPIQSIEEDVVGNDSLNLVAVCNGFGFACTACTIKHSTLHVDIHTQQHTTHPHSTHACSLGYSHPCTYLGWEQPQAQRARHRRFPASCPPACPWGPSPQHSRYRGDCAPLDGSAPSQRACVPAPCFASCTAVHSAHTKDNATAVCDDASGRRLRQVLGRRLQVQRGRAATDVFS
jgi:hypothetical protein